MSCLGLLLADQRNRNWGWINFIGCNLISRLSSILHANWCRL